MSSTLKKNKDIEKNILLSLEGTYPFHGGGVSTWAHILCSQIKGYGFKLYSVNALYEKKSKYDLSPSVNEIIQVPMWFFLEPKEIMRYGGTYTDFVQKKIYTRNDDIINGFIPLLVELLDEIYAEQTSVEKLEATIVAMWEYFQSHDYKHTLKSFVVWDCFKTKINTIITGNEIENVTLYDLTVAMRWIYHFLMSISIDSPRVSISHLTLSGFAIIPAIIQKNKYGTPIVITEHGVFIRERILAISQSEESFFLKDFLIRFSEIMTRLTYTKADKILSVNHFNLKWELMYGATQDKIIVIHNGIDHLRFVPRPKPAALVGIPTVVALARIFELKDILTMIRSCKVVKNVLPNIQYRVYGEDYAVPEYTLKCKALIKELGLEENFLLMGPHPKPETVFCDGDISILTSISEGFPYTILESFSCGIPVVSTDVGGVSEALTADCGILCKPKNHQEIGEAVLKILQDDELRAQMAINSRKKIESFFTIDTFIKQYQDVYDALLEHKEPSNQLAFC